MNTETSGVRNLMDCLMDELNRNRELLKRYEDIGPAGIFGTQVIKQKIRNGEEAVRSGDVIEMLRAYSQLKDTQ